MSGVKKRIKNTIFYNNEMIDFHKKRKHEKTVKESMNTFKM